ncbi:hypothetical protein [Streptomyces halobius]|uniref:Uncharacterized protein n=1 Tax=Streptomyces halobius TaxID=2879846 RepID=A0ABY4M1T6_9ACTN|nr:hypothetical protein [Streptomyces halobius]UQA91188.1 hypothetical protein K9S39_04195 [Streptomyces halobius]
MIERSHDEDDGSISSSVSRWKRLAALTVSGALLAGVAPLVTASPAEAWAQDCRKYLRSKGYRVPVPGKANTYCGYAEDYGTSDQGPEDAYLLYYCSNGLKKLGVKKKHASTACYKGTLI